MSAGQVVVAQVDNDDADEQVVVALVDNDADEVVLVVCADEYEAQALGSAAVWSDGGVSAYRVPEGAHQYSDRLRELLRAGESAANAVALARAERITGGES